MDIGLFSRELRHELISQKWYIQCYYLFLLLLLASIPLSKYTTSVFQFCLTGAWLLYNISFWDTKPGNQENKHAGALTAIGRFLTSVFYGLVEKFRLFFRNRPAMMIASLFLLHVIGLAYTTDFHYAFKDLRTKLPLLILPLFIATGPPVSRRLLNILLAGFSLAVLGGSIYRMILFLNLPVADPRAIQAHTSHIRFSLSAVFSVYILIYLLFRGAFDKTWLKAAAVALVLWLSGFMIYMHYGTGIVLLVAIAVILLFRKFLLSSSPRIRWISLSVILIIFTIPTLYILTTVKEYFNAEPVNFSRLDRYTANGNSYYHDTVNFRVENGRYAGLYICDKELRQEWARRSSLPYDGQDKKQQPLRFTLIRYLASRDLRKDSTGVANLSEEDIRAIEAGIVNKQYTQGFNLKGQINQFLIGLETYRKTGNPNAGSLIQRFEYWRTSLLIIRQNPVAGVGTGDVPDAFDRQYKLMNSKLDEQYRRRSHNQFLTVTIAFGAIGLIWFLYVLMYPFFRKRKHYDYYFFVFWCIAVLSMLTEDTIETQEGVTFFTAFLALLLLQPSESEEDKPHVIR